MLPMAYADHAEIDASRSAFTQALRELRSVCFASHDAAREALRAVGMMSPFFLPYQGRDDRALLTEFGELARDVVAFSYPRHQVAPTPPLLPEKKLRVGIVSGLFRRHSVWRLPTRGWVEAMDRSRFSVFGYHTRDERDDQTEYAARIFDRFTTGLRPLPEWVATIAADRPHVLIFPELAADQASMQLAALRLAPVQCATWGQPVTSGLPSIDYYLSSDAMEPADGEAHYTERLIRLPGLGALYRSEYATWGDALPVGDAWADFAFGLEAVRFLCCQSVQKYLPEHDHLYPDIAKALPEARFVFVAGQQRPSEILARRLTAAFGSAGLDPGLYCRFAPPLSQAAFSALVRDAQVFLDTPLWSGCNTTLDALFHGVPVVTLPGRFMRSRHGKAILDIVGCGETIAVDLNDYVSKAVRLGRDLGWRQVARAALAAGRHRLVDDAAPVRALEAFLLSAVARATAGRT